MVWVDRVCITYRSLWRRHRIYFRRVGLAYHWLLAFYLNHDRADNLLFTLHLVPYEIWDWAWLHWDQLLRLYLLTFYDVARLDIKWYATFHFRRDHSNFDQAIFLLSLLRSHCPGLNRVNMPLSNNMQQAWCQANWVPRREQRSLKEARRLVP